MGRRFHKGAEALDRRFGLVERTTGVAADVELDDARLCSALEFRHFAPSGSRALYDRPPPARRPAADESHFRLRATLFRHARGGASFFSKLARSVLRHIRVSSKQELKNRIMAAMDEFNRHPVVHTWSYKLDNAA